MIVAVALCHSLMDNQAQIHSADISDLDKAGVLRVKGRIVATYDPNAQDALNKVLEDLADDIIADDLSGMIQSDFFTAEWASKEDRFVWEEALFSAIRQNLMPIDGLGADEYRTAYSGDSVVKRYRNLNRLSDDLDPKNGESAINKIEYDCKWQTIVMGLLADRIEARVFTDFSQEERGQYRKPAHYRYVTGALNGVEMTISSRIGHAFMLSPLTGAVIEATSKNSEYKPPMMLSHIYQDLLAGMPFVTNTGAVYSGKYLYKNFRELPAIRNQAFANLLSETLQIAEKIDTQSGTPATYIDINGEPYSRESLIEHVENNIRHLTRAQEQSDFQPRIDDVARLDRTRSLLQKITSDARGPMSEELTLNTQ